MSDSRDPAGRPNPRAEALFERGNDAALNENYPYAIEMYRDACRLVPQHLAYRQALRGITRRRFNNEPGKVGMLASAKIQPVRLKLRGDKSKGNWEKVIEGCEDAFQINPWDVGTARDAAEAAGKLEWWNLACWYVESVFAQAETDQDFLKFAAEIFEGASRFQDAIKCLNRVGKLNPADEQSRRKINSLEASATIARSGLANAVAQRQAPATSPTPGGTASSTAESASDSHLETLKRPAETPEQKLIREIQEEPGRAGHYLELADLLIQQKRHEEAEKVLAAGRKALPEDEVVRGRHVEVQLIRLKRALEHWTKKAQLEPENTEAAEKCQAIQEKLDAYELHERKHRVQDEPGNAEHRLAYGICLARLGNHDLAIAEFQQARTLGNSSLRVEAQHQSGLSFEAKGLLKLAGRSYQEALKAADQDDTELLKTLHYRLGRVAEAQGDLRAAEEHYNEIAANDYSFLDVAERLRALNQKG